MIYSNKRDNSFGAAAVSSKFIAAFPESSTWSQQIFLCPLVFPVSLVSPDVPCVLLCPRCPLFPLCPLCPLVSIVSLVSSVSPCVPCVPCVPFVPCVPCVLCVPLCFPRVPRWSFTRASTVREIF